MVCPETKGAIVLRVIVAVIIGTGCGIITLAAPPIAAAGKCDPGYYWSRTHGDCVERPDNNPANATARCNDGLYSHSQTPGADENCSGHGGVAQMCPCAGAAGPNSWRSPGFQHRWYIAGEPRDTYGRYPPVGV